jgi:hypothetical protein
MSVQTRGLCLLAAIALTALAAPAGAQDRTKVGVLRCDVSGGLGFIITGTRQMECQFKADGGFLEKYWGQVHRFGLDIGATTDGVLGWTVLAPTAGPRRGALAGEYAGVGASATVGAGVGANALLGGSDRATVLQPLSLQVQGGLELSAGVESLSLHVAE